MPWRFLLLSERARQESACGRDETVRPTSFLPPARHAERMEGSRDYEDPREGLSRREVVPTAYREGGPRGLQLPPGGHGRRHRLHGLAVLPRLSGETHASQDLLAGRVFADIGRPTRTARAVRPDADAPGQHETQRHPQHRVPHATLLPLRPREESGGCVRAGIARWGTQRRAEDCGPRTQHNRAPWAQRLSHSANGRRPPGLRARFCAARGNSAQSFCWGRDPSRLGPEHGTTAESGVPDGLDRSPGGGGRDYRVAPGCVGCHGLLYSAHREASTFGNLWARAGRIPYPPPLLRNVLKSL